MTSLVDWCREASRGHLDGVTISGGEPFDQPEALLALLEELTSWRANYDGRFDILLYSGYVESRLRSEFARHLRRVDAVVAGPFLENAGSIKPFCGSDNQQLLKLSPLGEERYGPESLAHWKSGMQAAADDEGIWMIGIPKPGDLAKLEAGCAQKGLILEDSSWRC